MENVSHNTSFDSAEEDNLSRDPNQLPFDEQDSPNVNVVEMAPSSLIRLQEQQLAAIQEPVMVPRQPQLIHNKNQPNFIIARESLAETEKDAYGFQASAANPTEQMRQLYWQEFQRQQQSQSSLLTAAAPHQYSQFHGQLSEQQKQSAAGGYMPFSPDANMAPDEDVQSIGIQSRPTAAFGHHNQNAASGTVLNYPDEIQIEDDQHEMMMMQKQKDNDYFKHRASGQSEHQLLNPANSTANAGYNSNTFHENQKRMMQQQRDGNNLQYAGDREGDQRHPAHDQAMVHQSRMMTDQAHRNRQTTYREELSRRYYANEQLQNQLLVDQPRNHDVRGRSRPNEEAGLAQAADENLTGMKVNHGDEERMAQVRSPASNANKIQNRELKKRSTRKADFINSSDAASGSYNNVLNQSHTSSKQSIMESVRNQASRQMTPKHHEITHGSSDRAKTEQTVSQPHSRTQSNNFNLATNHLAQPNHSHLQSYSQSDMPIDDQLGTSAIAHNSPELKASKRLKQRAASRQDAVSIKAKLITMLKIKLSHRCKQEALLKKLAFEKFYSNRQNAILDQLLIDNENLMDQVQTLQAAQQPTFPRPPAGNAVNPSSTKHNDSSNYGGDGDRVDVDEDASSHAYQLYHVKGGNSHQRSVKQRNNSKTDQTHHNTFQPAISSQLLMQMSSQSNAGQHAEHNNSSNKDFSPAKQASKDTAFMRAMLRDEAPVQLTPFNFRPSRGSHLLADEQNQNSNHGTQFFEDFARQLRQLARECNLNTSGGHVFDENNSTLFEDGNRDMKAKLNDLSQTFDFELEKIRGQVMHLAQQKDLLATKVQGVDRLELDNLELHMQLDAKLRALETLLRCGSDSSKLFKFDYKKVSDSVCQTETVYKDIVQKEASLQVFSKELSLVKLRQEEDYSSKVRDLDKRECDLEIRERLIEEKRIEYSYKQKELNQRIKSQMTWPLNCLENDTRLLEKFKDFKLKPDQLKSLEADSNLNMFLQREENLQLMQGFEGPMLAKCEGLLHFEYLILKERAKNVVFHENTLQELQTLQSESEELAKDRERYQITADFERQLQQESQRLEKSRYELEKIQENLFGIIKLINDAFQQQAIGVQTSASQHSSVSPQPKSTNQLPTNQLNLLLGNLQKSYQSGQTYSHQLQPQLDSHTQIDTPLASSGISPSINPYSQTINAKDPATLLQVVHDYRASDPMLNKLQTRDMQSLIEQTIEHLESSSRVQNAHSSSPSAEQDSQNLRQIRRMLVRDAYFLQKERQWIDQERLKLNKMLSSRTKHRNVDRRTAQVQTSLERFQASNSMVGSPERPDQHHVINLHRVNASQPASALDESRQHMHLAASPAESISILSTMDQDRKKIQLLQTNLGLEKEYNRELNTQLTAQMELIKMQNEKLIEGENHINEMKLRLLIKFEQIKILEDYYNRQHLDSFEKQIHLDIELDEEQLKQIVIQLYQKHQQEDSNFAAEKLKVTKGNVEYFEDDVQSKQLISVNQFLEDHDDGDDDEDDGLVDNAALENHRNGFSGSHSRNVSQNQTLDLAANVAERKHYTEFWAQEGVASILRHLLMDRCRWNPAQHRLQYAFMLFRTATLRERSSPRHHGSLAHGDGSQTALHKLLGENMNQSMSIAMQEPRQQEQNVIDTEEDETQELKRSQRIVVMTTRQSDNINASSGPQPDEASMEWFQIYWRRQRERYYMPSDAENPSAYELRQLAEQLENDIATFWKFRARNTLRLMQLHSARRQRMLHAFAFQKFKVQTMRLTIHKILQTQVEAQTRVQILLSQNQSEDELASQQVANRKQNSVRVSDDKDEMMTIGKRHAIVLMLTMRSSKCRELRDKNRVFNKWRESVKDANNFTIQLEMARLAKEVETIRFREEVLRTDFTVKKTEMESKVNMLLGLLAQ